MKNAQRRARLVQAVDQDKLLRGVVRAIEEALNAKHFPKRSMAWSWLATESKVSRTTLSNWQNKKTRSCMTRTANAALKPLGKTLGIINLE